MNNAVVFETLRSDSILLSDHIDRLFQSSKHLGLTLSAKVTRDALEKAFLQAIDQWDGPNPFCIKIEADESGFDLKSSSIVSWPEVIDVDTFRYERPNSKAKYATEHYADMRKEAEQRGVDELVYVNKNDFILEGSVTNVFLIIDGILVTPKEGILPGIMRQTIIKKAKSEGFEVEQRPVKMAEITKASQAFVTNSLRGVVPIKSWGDHEFTHFS